MAALHAVAFSILACRAASLQAAGRTRALAVDPDAEYFTITSGTCSAQGGIEITNMGDCKAAFGALGSVYTSSSTFTCSAHPNACGAQRPRGCFREGDALGLFPDSVGKCFFWGSGNNYACYCKRAPRELDYFVVSRGACSAQGGVEITEMDECKSAAGVVGFAYTQAPTFTCAAHKNVCSDQRPRGCFAEGSRLELFPDSTGSCFYWGSEQTYACLCKRLPPPTYIRASEGATYIHSSGGTLPGLALTLNACPKEKGFPNCQWVFERSATRPGFYYIKASDRNTYITAVGGTKAGGPLMMLECKKADDPSNCQWALKESGTRPGMYYIKAPDQHAYVYALGGTTVGNPLVLKECSEEEDDGNCQWMIELLPAGITLSPTLPPTETPTPNPTSQPTPAPTPMPTETPTPSPTPLPSEAPTASRTPCRTGPGDWGIADVKLDSDKLVQNNLDGKGPSRGEAVMRFSHAIDTDAFAVDLVLTSLSPFMPGQNYASGKGTGVAGHVGAISIQSQSTVVVKFSFYEPDTYNEIKVHNLWVSVMDIDGDEDDGDFKESVTFKRVTSWKLDPETEVEPSESGESVTFTSTMPDATGGKSNPTHALSATRLQAKRAVSVKYDNVSSFVITFSAKGGNATKSRIFMFGGRCGINFDRDGCPAGA